MKDRLKRLFDDNNRAGLSTGLVMGAVFWLIFDDILMGILFGLIFGGGTTATVSACRKKTK
jgi:hypothetical protein